MRLLKCILHFAFYILYTPTSLHFRSIKMRAQKMQVAGRRINKNKHCKCHSLLIFPLAVCERELSSFKAVNPESGYHYQAFIGILR